MVQVLEFGATFAFYRRKVRFYCHGNALFPVRFLGLPIAMKGKCLSGLGLRATWLWVAVPPSTPSLSLGGSGPVPCGLGAGSLSQFCHSKMKFFHGFRYGFIFSIFSVLTVYKFRPELAALALISPDPAGRALDWGPRCRQLSIRFTALICVSLVPF